MANESQQAVQNFSVDISKLDAEIKRLQQDNERLRKTQENLNVSFKKGQISASEFKNKMQETTAAMKKNQGMCRDLIGALGGLGAPISGLANQIGALFSGPMGIASVAITAIAGIYNFLKEENAKAEEAAKQRMETHRKMVEEEKAYERELLMASGKSEIQAYEQQIAEFDKKIEESRKKREEAVLAAAKYQTSGEMVKEYESYIKLSMGARQRWMDRIITTEKQLEKDKADFVKKLEEARKKQRVKDVADVHEAEMAAIKEQEEYIKKQADMRKTLEEKVKDLQILLIEDTNEQKIAKIKLEEERQIAAYDKEYQTATAQNKKLIDQVKALIKETNALQIKAINDSAKVSNEQIDKQINKIKQFISTYKSDFKVVDPQMQTEIEKLNGLLSEEAYIIRTRNNEDKKFMDQRDKSLTELSAKLKKTLQEISDLENTTTDEALLGQLNETRLAAQQEYENNRVAIVQEANLRIEQNHLETEQKIEELQKKTAESSLQAWGGAFSGMGDLFGSLAEMQEENSEKQKKLQMMGIFMNIASAIMTATANALQAGWPAMLATVPAAVAMVVAQVVQAKKMMAQAEGHSRGGNVWGPGSGTSDDVPARLSNGESVIVTKATSMYAPLLSAINQSAGGEPIRSAENNNNLAVILARAMAAQPAPIVAVESIENATQVYKTVQVLGQL